jgi:hypothetical protein
MFCFLFVIFRLGAYHDGEAEARGCASNSGYIMSYSREDAYKFSRFSPCSISSFQNLLKYVNKHVSQIKSIISLHTIFCFKTKSTSAIFFNVVVFTTKTKLTFYKKRIQICHMCMLHLSNLI